MKKWIYTLSLMGALAVGANADVITHETPTLVDGCYQITNAGELFGFADIVNGTNSATKNASACGKLVHDLRIVQFPERPVGNDDPTDEGNDDSGEEQQYAFGPNNHVVDNTLNIHNVPEENIWTPMVDFAGTFDGQGHTISGLYYSGSNAGFFASLTGNATVKRLNINDSYFESNDYVGGLAAKVFGSDSVTIDNCSFKGLVDAISNKETSTIAAGGIAGIIEIPTKLTLTASVNEGAILPLNGTSSAKSGGLIGNIPKEYESYNQYLMIKDNICYGFVGGKGQRGVVGFLGPNKNFINNKNNFCYGTGELCGGKSTCSNTENVSQCKVKLKELIVTTLNKAGFKGVKFEVGDNGRIIIAHITEWEDPEDPEHPEKESEKIVLDKLLIPQTIAADSVEFDRKFNGKSSTIMLPFDILASNITDEHNEIFVEFSSMPTIDTKKWEANAETETNMISANKPYLLKAPTGKIHFHGPITLKTNYERFYQDSQGNSKAGYQYEYNAPTASNDWTLVGTYRTMLTMSVADKINKDTISKYERMSSLDHIYGFVGTANVSDNGYDFTLGEFAVAGYNVRTREMRAYLIYEENTPSPASAPAYRGMPMLRAASAVSVDELPDRIPVKLTSKPIIPESQFVDPTLKTTKVIATINVESTETDCNDESCEEGPLTVTKPFISPLKSNKIDRWQDAMGRRLNGKPTKRGTYFKNGIPVIIK